jgi:hypothetical protein
MTGIRWVRLEAGPAIQGPGEGPLRQRDPPTSSLPARDGTNGRTRSQGGIRSSESVLAASERVVRNLLAWPHTGVGTHFHTPGVTPAEPGVYLEESRFRSLLSIPVATRVCAPTRRAPLRRRVRRTATRPSLPLHTPPDGFPSKHPVLFLPWRELLQVISPWLRLLGLMIEAAAEPQRAPRICGSMQSLSCQAPTSLP